MGKVADGFVRQVMPLVEHVERVLRVWQYGAAAEGKVGQDHVMVGDDHVYLAHAFPGLEEGALLEIRAMAVGALAMVGGKARPDRIFQRLGPAVTVTVPTVASQLLDHFGEQFEAGLIHVDGKAFVLEQLGGGVLRLPFLQQGIELGQAQVAPTPLGQGEGEVEPGVAHDLRA